MVCELDDDVRRFLESRPGWMVLTTLGPDGFPHTVPVGYVLLGEHVYLGVRDGTQKVRNLERDARVSLMLASAREASPQRGIMIQGTGEVIRDLETLRAIRLAAGRARGTGPRSEDPPPGMLYLRVTPRRVRRWTVGGPPGTPKIRA